MIRHLKRHINIVLLAAVWLVAGSCSRHGEVWNKLDAAEELMGFRPDSALALLDSIPPSSLGGEEAAARYALLKSMALDKNYIDTTTFCVLQPAIDYYLKSGTPDERLRTHYYQGRIYQNRGDDGDAMHSFMEACALGDEVTDSLMLARALVAQGTLYFKQYRVEDFTHNNLKAAEIYGAIERKASELRSYTKALDGFVLMDDKPAADSILSICVPLAQNNRGGESDFFTSLLSYKIQYGTLEDVKAFLDKYQDWELTEDDTFSFVRGYLKIGEYDKALHCLSGINRDGSMLKSLKYASIKTMILEKQGKHEQALGMYKEYTATLERYHGELLSQGLLFADKKHQLEVENLREIQGRDRIIWSTLCGILGLLLFAGWLYYRGYKKELVAANLRFEISRLESERDSLKELQGSQSEWSKPLQKIIESRFEMLNGLLAREITSDESHAKSYYKWIESVRSDKQKFMDSTRLAFTASHPKFIDYLEQHGLSADEINYLCLYAIGLCGKEVGEYIQLKRHYSISSEIRKKLGMGEHETNIGIYVRRLLKESGGIR